MSDSLAIVILAALLIDALVGDPEFALHPVRLTGALAAKAEAAARKVFSAAADEGSRTRQLMAGFAAWIAVCASALASALLLGSLARRLGAIPGVIADSLIIWASIAPSDLARHASRIERALRSDLKSGLPHPLAGRIAVSAIVGRKTENLTYGEVSRAAVESVAESSIDGVAAPLFWACAFGPPGAFVYRAVNTMDSMFGHKNHRYLHFGFFPARADDVANFLPARLSSLLACLVSPLMGFSLKGSLRSFLKYRLAHASPNAGHPEAAYAGALGVSLGGPVSYEEGTVDKPFMNPEGREPVPGDIGRAVRLMYAQTVLGAFAFLACRFALEAVIK